MYFVKCSVNRHIASMLYINHDFSCILSFPFLWLKHCLGQDAVILPTPDRSGDWTMWGLIKTAFTITILSARNSLGNIFLLASLLETEQTKIWHLSERLSSLWDTQRLSCLRFSLEGEQAFSGSCWEFIQSPVHDQEDTVEKQGYLLTQPLQSSVNTVLQQVSLDRRVTSAQPSARVQRLIYCLIAWPQFQSKNGSKGCIMKVKEEEGRRIRVCLECTTWLNAFVTVWMLDNL